MENLGMFAAVAGPVSCIDMKDRATGADEPIWLHAVRVSLPSCVQ